ncbi:MAG: ABC transporter substrate-binding protein [Chloroflexota bacterium]|nr:ABC transporter substrate-binding protein [Chloroflexota bacterium]
MKKTFGLMPVLVLVLALGVLASCGPETTPAAPTAAATVEAPTALSASGTAAPTAGQPGTLTTIRLGYVPVSIYAPLFVAQERGYFRAEGLDVKLSPVQGGSDSVVQLAAGNFDAAVGGAGAGLFNAAKRGVKFTIVAPMHTERPPLASPLVISAKRAEEFKSVADLKGKKVSINATGAATEYWLAQALQKAGMSMGDITLKTVAFRDVPAALQSGSLDAAILGEPLATINKDKGIVKVLSDDFINGFVSTFLYMGDPLLKGKPEAARGFMRAYLEACRDLQGNYLNKDIATIIEKYTQVPADVTMRSSHAYYDPNGNVPIADLNTLQSYFLSRGNELTYKDPIDVTTLVNSDLAKQAVADLDKK